MYVYTYKHLHLHLFLYLPIYIENEFMPITLTTGFILLFSFSIFLILFFSDSEKPGSPDSQCNFLLHQVLGCNQSPVAALGDALLTLPCSVPSNQATQPLHTHTVSLPFLSLSKWLLDLIVSERERKTIFSFIFSCLYLKI